MMVGLTGLEKWLKIFVVKVAVERPIFQKILEQKIKKFKLIEARKKNINDKLISNLNSFECLIIDNFDNNINENLFYSVLNQSKQLDTLY